jgi:hypothetical protein
MPKEIATLTISRSMPCRFANSHASCGARIVACQWRKYKRKERAVHPDREAGAKKRFYTRYGLVEIPCGRRVGIMEKANPLRRTRGIRTIAIKYINDMCLSLQ